MLKRLIRCKLTILAIALTSLSVSQAQTNLKLNPGEDRRSNSDEDKRRKPMRISSYKDDPFVRESIVERMDPSRFDQDADGRFMLRSDRVEVLDEAIIYRQDPKTGVYKPFAWNPWPE